MQTVVVSLPYYSRFDAISNDVRGQIKAFGVGPYETYLFASACEAGLEDELISESHFLELIQKPGTIWIYHLGVFWSQLMPYLEQSRCRFVLKFHNITPSKFFKKYDLLSYYATREGLAQVRELLANHRIDLFIGASQYNVDEAKANLGLTANIKTVVIPPFVLLDELQTVQEDLSLRQTMKSHNTINLLFVGRLVPNKGHKHLIAAVAAYYQLYGREQKLRLFLLGKISPNLATYQRQLNRLAEILKVEDSICYIPAASRSELATYYTYADVFVLASEHEGFCVPIVEAQHFGCPVVAFASSAVQETLGESQMVWDDIDYNLMACSINRIVSDRNLKAALIAAGKQNVLKYSEEAIGQRLLAVIDQLSQS